MSNCPYDTDNDGDCPRCHKHGGCFLKQTQRRMRPLIFGMEPWMFWSLLATVLFALFAPFLAMLFR